ENRVSLRRPCDLYTGPPPDAVGKTAVLAIPSRSPKLLRKLSPNTPAPATDGPQSQRRSPGGPIRLLRVSVLLALLRLFLAPLAPWRPNNPPVIPAGKLANPRPARRRRRSAATGPGPDTSGRGLRAPRARRPSRPAAAAGPRRARRPACPRPS